MSSSDPFDDFGKEEDVGLGEESKDEFKNDRDSWFKMELGQVVRGALLYFHTITQTSMAALHKSNPKASREEVMAAVKQAHEAKATALGKTVDQLTEIDKLDITEIFSKRFDYHYEEGLGYVLSRIGKDGPEADKIWKSLPEVKRGYSTVLLLYPMLDKKSGNINKETIAKDFKVVPWRFPKQTQEQIWQRNAGLRENNLSLASQDVKLECKDPKYQKIDVNFAGPAIWQKADKFRNVVLTMALEWYPKLVPFREMSTDQLRAKKGFGAPAAVDVSGGDFSNLLDNM